MEAVDLANEIGDLFRIASALEKADHFPEAIMAFDLANQLLAEFTSEVDRKLVAVRHMFEETAEPSL